MNNTLSKTRNYKGKEGFSSSQSTNWPCGLVEVGEWERVFEPRQSKSLRTSIQWQLTFCCKNAILNTKFDSIFNDLHCITLKVSLLIYLDWYSGGFRENSMLTRLATKCG
jgi:hypothetical protein